MPTQVRSTEMTNRFSEIFSESIVDLSDPDAAGQLKSLLDEIESAVAEHLREAVGKLKGIADNNKKIRQWLQQYPETFNVPPEAFKGEFDLWLTPEADTEIDAGHLYSAGRRLRGWIGAIAAFLGAVEFGEQTIGVYAPCAPVNPPPDLLYAGRLEPIRKLSKAETTLVAIHDQCALLMEICHYTSEIRGVDDGTLQPRSPTLIVLLSFNLGSLARLCDSRQVEPDVKKGRKNRSGTSRGGKKSGVTRSKPKDGWLPVYQDLERKIRSEPGRSSLSNKRVSELIVERLKAMGLKVKKGTSPSVSPELQELFRESDWRAKHSPGRIAHLLAGRP